MKRARPWLTVGLRRFARVLAFVAACGCGCGYAPIHSTAPEERLCVSAAPSKVPDFGAIHAALRGAREELARAGALSSAGALPCLRLELLRVEERATGLVVGSASGRDVPAARGTVVRVRGRGWVERAPGAVSRDTGDITREARGPAGFTSAVDAESHQQLVRAAAEAVGRALAQRVLGLPTPSE